MSRKRVTLCLVAGVLVLALSRCPGGGLSDQDILRSNDVVDPVVTITSHVDDDPYAPITSITGSISDLANAAGIRDSSTPQPLM